MSNHPGLAFVLATILLLSSTVAPVGAAANLGGDTGDATAPTAEESGARDETSAGGDVSSPVGQPSLSSVDWSPPDAGEAAPDRSGPPSLTSVDWSAEGQSSASNTRGAGGHHDYETPPKQHQGFGAPADPASGQGGVELSSSGGPPVPGTEGQSGSPPSVPAAIRAAQSGQLDEVGANANARTLEGARDSHVTAMTESEQAAALQTATATSGSAVCPAGADTRQFDVSAVSVDIVYNSYGLHDPNGVMYVLDSKKDDLREQVRNSPDATVSNPDPDATSELVQPLTIRAQVGECVKIRFTNELNKNASMSPNGVGVAPNSSGTTVGNNANSFAAPGETVTYTWHVQKKGAFFFSDKAQPVMHDGDDTLKQHGLFGSLVVYEQGTEWLDPETGEPTRSGQKVMVEDPNGPDYRDFAVYYHDGSDPVKADGTSVKHPGTTKKQAIYPMNYRADPTGMRLREDCKVCDKKELFYSSWLHGDPGGGDLVFPTYVGDPVTWRLVGAQVEEKHVDHHHGHRWKSEPHDPNSNTQDAQSISAGATYTREFIAGFGDDSARPSMSYEEAFGEGGAGYVQGSPGDYIFHCHLFPHYANGMWSLMRVYDKDTRDMDQSKPGVYQLQPLPDRAEPPTPEGDDPGYPNFIPAAEDKRPPKPPGLPGGREPTPVEESAINGSGMSDPIKPGAPYADPCPDDAETITYNVSVIRTNITYNNGGDYDPDATIYTLSKWVDEIKNGEMRPRPLIIRANQGQCVEIEFTNELSPDTEPNEVSMHVHFVGYDALGSDGVTLGYNYDEGAEPVGEDASRVVSPKNGDDYRVESTGNITYRWYADEQGTIFWHDHLIGLEEGMHGLYAALIVEPEDSKWLDPETGEPIRAGTKAMIKDPNGQNHREFVLTYQDFVPLKNGGEYINNNKQHNLNHGSMGINYANAPLYNRNDEPSAYGFSSWMHEEPKTPLLRTYPNEPVKVRVLQGTFEEAHNFMINGVRWKQEPDDASSPTVANQVFGVSEQFVASFDSPPDNPADLEVEDHLYGSFAMEDLWNGMWGYLRVYGSEVNDLEPVPGHEPPSGVITDDERSLLNETDTAPSAPPQPGSPCPAGADTRTYDVVAFQRNVTYNDYGDHDPHGIAYATKENYEAIINGDQPIKPMVLRAEKGECIEVTLTNKLPSSMDQHADHPQPPVPAAWNNSNRISLHPTLLNYTTQYSDGGVVGYNYDSTVGPGEAITYRWYADKQVGATQLFDMADPRSHRHHGAYGMLVVEPDGSKWLDPETGEPTETGTRAIIVQPNGEDFREYALMPNDGRYMVNNDGTCPVPGGEHADPDDPCNQLGNPEDQGFYSVNYRSESLIRRLNDDSREHMVFSSRVHGDPATPVVEAYRGDPVTFRVAQAADHERGVSFRLEGHVFPYQSTEDTQYTGVRGELSPGKSVDIVPANGAGGPGWVAGDYYYGATKMRNFIEGGIWGVFRVRDEPADIEPLPDRRPDAPTNLSADPVNETTVALDWDDHPNPDVTGYNVYRALNGTDTYQQINDAPVSVSEFNDTDALPGTGYNYTVTAVDTYGQETRRSAVAQATTHPLVDPTNATDAALNGSVNLETELELEAESDDGMDRVEFEVDDGATVAEQATFNSTSGLWEVSVDTTTLVDGDHEFRFRAVDTKGRTTKRVQQVRVDNTAPEFETSVDGTLVSTLDVAVSDPVTVGVDASDTTTAVSTVEIKIDDGSWRTVTDDDGDGVWETELDTTKFADGKHKLHVRSVDKAGNVNSKTHSLRFDNTKPSYDAYLDGTLISLLDAALSGDVDLEVDATDDLSGVELVEYAVDDGDYTEITDDDGDGVWETTVDTTKYDDGDHIIRIKVLDSAGNTKIKEFSISIDNVL